MVVMRRAGATKAAPASKKAAAPVSKKAAPSKPTRARDDEDDQDDGDDEDEGREAAPLRGGWGAAEENIDATSSWAQGFKLTAQTQIIRFLEDKPYVSYRRHWIEVPGQGNRPYTCLESIDRDCPLCDVGEKAQAVASFNIIVVSDDGSVSHKSWDTGPSLTKPLMTMARDPKIGPLNRAGLYFAVSKPESKHKFDKTVPIINMVRERDLEEDYGAVPPTEAAVKKVMRNLYTPDVVSFPKRSELQELVEDLVENGGAEYDNDEDDNDRKPRRR